MGGALLQLVAYGAQDVYLTGQPQITFFKSVYRRHTNFSVESIEQNTEDIPRLGTRVTYTIGRNGDLLKRLWIQYSPYDSIIERYNYYKSQGVYINTIANDFSHALLEQIEIEIGGQVIDRHYGKWLSVWRDLTEINPYTSQSQLDISGKRIESNFDIVYNKMAYTHTGIAKSIKVIPGDTGSYGLNLLDSPKECYIPLQFWFCRNPGLAIPLIALQLHDVKLNINISGLNSFLVLNKVINDENDFFNLSKNFKLYGDYVFLDSIERTQFTLNNHQYLIEQLQRKSSQNTSNIALNFNHPIKEIIITGQPSNPNEFTNYDLIDNDSPLYNSLYDPQVHPYNSLPPPFSWWDTTDGAATPLPIISLVQNSSNSRTSADNASRTEATVQLIINGKEQFSARNLKYFTRTQIYNHHTGSGSGTYGRIGVYSFALRPEEHQPSGSCNFSMINDARIIFRNLAVNEILSPLDVYGINYNVLRITSGMGGIVYSN